LLLVVVHNGRGFLDLLEFGAVQQSFQQRRLIMQKGRNGCLTSLCWQERTRDIKEVCQVDEHRSVSYRFHQSDVTVQRTPNGAMSKRVDGVRIADDMQYIIPVLLVLNMETRNAVDTGSRQDAAQRIHRSSLLQCLL